jgi:FkbM family methyltransferase
MISKQMLNFLRRHHTIGTMAIDLFTKFRPKGQKIVKTHGLKMFVDWGADPALLLLGQYSEAFETKLFEESLRDDSVVVDVGANMGWYTLIAAKRYKTCKVYAFEPDLAAYSLLVNNVHLNELQNVFVSPNAVSNTDGSTTFYISRGWSGSSLANENSGERSTPIPVKMITLDNFFEKKTPPNKLDILKMDVEGAEGLILNGAKNLLRLNNIKIFMEFSPRMLSNLGSNPKQTLQELEEQGYKINIIDENNRKLIPTSTLEILTKWRTSENPDNWRANLYLEKMSQH